MLSGTAQSATAGQRAKIYGHWQLLACGTGQTDFVWLGQTSLLLAPKMACYLWTIQSRRRCILKGAHQPGTAWLRR